MVEGRKIRAVIIDDEPFARVDLVCALEGLPEKQFEILGEAGNIIEARRLLDTVLPEVVFLDLDLRGGSGLDLLDAIVAPARVIVVSAHHASMAELAADARLRYWIDKPVTEEQLLAVLEGLP
jgi:two-component system LytT family response regulator